LGCGASGKRFCSLDMDDSSVPPRIETRKLVREFGKRRVVNDVNINVSAGEIVGLLGPNGAGKTTTFYMVVGLIKATSGEVFLNDKDLTGLPMYRRARHGIGYLPQEASVFRKMTVEQNIRAVAETLPLSKSARDACVQEHLAELGLEHLASQKAYTLSGGERRRLEISRALVTRPKFLLMDEPFSGVDPISVSEVQKIILQLKDRGIGVLITDHNVRETLRIVDRAYLLHQGSVLCEGTSDFLINDAKSKEFYLGHDFNM
jgi:lipopolysaccharide export system ATP-binding protein